MSKQEDESTRTSRRQFTKAAITALALSPIVSAHAGEHEGQRDPKLFQSSPITVGGGGSVGIDFGGRIMKSGANKISFDQDSLHKLWLIDKYGALENITPSTEACIVNIQCKKGSKVSTITITGSPLTIAFDPNEFKRSKPSDGKKEIHHNMNYKIVDIAVHDTAANTTTTYEAPTGGKCTIVVVDLL